MPVYASPSPLRASSRTEAVRYEIRGELARRAAELEAQGRAIAKLNIGNPAAFGFEAPEEILLDVIRHLPNAQGYSDSQGLMSARTAVVLAHIAVCRPTRRAWCAVSAIHASFRHTM